MSKRSRSMKAIKNISMIMGAALMLASCESIKEEVIPSENTVEITAFIADGQTKTAVQDGGNAVYWQPGDEVKVFYDGTGSKFTAMCTSLSRTSKFTGSSNVIFGFDEGFAGDAPLWGLYPYRDDAIADNVSITTTLPSEQTACAGTFAQGMNISVARSTSLSMAFYNVCGGLRFTLSQEGIKSVTFQGLNDENIAGTMKISFSEGVPVIQEVTNGKRSITLTLPDDGVFETGKWYYISILPGSLSSGYKMTFTTDKRTAAFESETPVSVKRGIFGQITNVDEGLPIGKNIIFKDLVAKYACVEKFDADGDGELSYEEAAVVTDITGLFSDWNGVEYFDELQYFTSLDRIDGYTFIQLKKLKQVTVPSNVKIIDSNAFENCTSLVSVRFADDCSLSAIGRWAFYGCKALREITLPSGVRSIDQDSFRYCDELEHVFLNDGLEQIGNNAFTGCKSLKTVNIPNSVTQLGVAVFLGCTSLISATLPSGIIEIPYDTFCDCDIRTISIPETVISIGDGAFGGCTFLHDGSSSVTIPESVKSIGRDCFTGVQNILLPSNSLVSIGNRAWGYFAKIYVPSSLVDRYKMRSYWDVYADSIYPLEDYCIRESSPAPDGTVDLGLSVFWATTNLGTTGETGRGDYYAWGETSTKSSFTISNYLYCNGTETSYTKYNSDSSYGYVDNIMTLDLEDDAAHVQLGGKFRIPTRGEFSELIALCYLSRERRSGVYGYCFTSKINGNTIFLPATGGNFGRGPVYTTERGYYRTSSRLEGSAGVVSYMVVPEGVSGGITGSSTWRYAGFPIRPVSD